MMDSMKGMCSCPHHKMFWIFMVVFGLVFLLGDLNVLTQAAVTWTWPVLVILAGLTKMMGSRCTCCSKDHGGVCMNCGKDGGMSGGMGNMNK